MDRPLGILPHDAFKEIAAAADFRQYRFDPRARVADEAAFAEMQDYIANLYQGVDAVNSFEDPAGAVFDSVPIDQQPSLREHAGPIPQPPDLRPVLQGEEPRVVATVARPREEAPLDRHGNPMQAPPGTVPIRRVTLGELARFEDLQDFRRKYPAVLPTALPPSVLRPSTPDPDTSKNHRYAYADQTVDNIGGHTALSVYAPAIDANQVFSLAQHWYTGGSGSGHQTLEVGWQVYPNKYGHASPVLFIYWTADNYGSTGAYNLDAPGFVQTNGVWTIGGALAPASVRGGQQMEIEVAFYLFNGNWWLYLGGLAPENTVGYYPTSLYSGGQMAHNATEILFGGETVTASVSWPSMGSGEMASAGWQQAAYQRDIFYFPVAGGAEWTSLTDHNPSPSCYTLATGAVERPWGIYFFFGGSGGGDC